MPSPNISVVAPVAASSSVDDPVPADVHAVIELFAGPLAKVSFPEIDAGTLRRQAEELRTESRAVARAREALEAAQASFAARRAALSETSARAVAYARIYSEAHPDREALATAIAALSEPAPIAAPGAPTGKRRGRPPRRSAELFDGPPAEHADEPA
jgi:hypothetical protein